MQTFVTIVVLPRGRQTATRGIAVSYRQDIGELAQQLPRPDSGLIVITVDNAQQRDPPEAAARRGPPSDINPPERDPPARDSLEVEPETQQLHTAGGGAAAPMVAAAARGGRGGRTALCTVNYHKMRAALAYLMSHNPLYADITINTDDEFQRQRQQQEQQPGAAPVTDTDMAGAADDEYDERELQHSTVLPADPALPVGAAADVANPRQAAARLQAAARREHFTLYRLGGRPVSYRDGIALEALSHPVLYPLGRNYYGAPRRRHLGDAMYWRSRLLHEDSRFRTSPLWVAHALSLVNINQLNGICKAALRMSRGPMPTVGQLRARLTSAEHAGQQAADAAGGEDTVVDTTGVCVHIAASMQSSLPFCLQQHDHTCTATKC